MILCKSAAEKVWPKAMIIVAWGATPGTGCHHTAFWLKAKIKGAA
jgi:hypothetical protein